MKNTFLSICAFSSINNVEYNVVPFYNDKTNVHAEIPIGPNVNTVIHTFKPVVNGLSFIQARINIPNVQAYINASGLSTLVINNNWKVYLSINGVLLPQYVTFESSGNQPFVLNSLTNVFPSTLIVNGLADLRPTDEVQIIMNCTEVFVLIPTAPFFTILDDGKIVADFSINTIANKKNVSPHGLLKTPDNNLVIPLNTDMLSAVEFPLTNATLSYNQNFSYVNGELIYNGTHPSWVKVNASINLEDLQLNTSDSDDVTVFVATYGLFVGIDGQIYNNLVTETNIYRDTRYTICLLSNQTTENVLRIRPGERVSLLLYAYNAVYVSGAPVAGVPIKTPAVGSTITVTGNVNLTLE